MTQDQTDAKEFAEIVIVQFKAFNRIPFK